MESINTALVLFVLISSISIDSSRAFCPIGCLCVDDDTSPSVDCDGANLDSIPILFNPRIRSLTLSNNRISSITLDELSFYTELEYLDLSNNKILSIERGAFYRLQKLKALRLNSNLLATLGVETFAGLNELRALDLGGNGLNRLATSIFSDLRRLETLNVTKNSIAHISPGALAGLTSLKELHLQHNELTTIPKVALHAPQSLKVLDLSYNRLETVGEESFIHLGRLETLNLAGNGIETIDERAFNGLRNLRHLYLDTNRLRKVPTDSFRPLTELDSLSLSENLIDELTTSAFEGLSRLRQLTISRCPQLRSVSINAFSGLHTLESLVLSENRALATIDPMAFELLQRSRIDTNVKLRTSLRQLYVFGNNLTELPPSLLPWRQLNELDLRSNPWTCDCGFATWVGRALRRVYGQRGSYPDGAVCSQNGLDELRGKYLHSLRGGGYVPSNSDDGGNMADDDRVDYESWMATGTDAIDLGPYCRSMWTNGVMDTIFVLLPVLACLTAVTVLVCVCLRYRRRIGYCCGCCSKSNINDDDMMAKKKPPPPGLPDLFRSSRGGANGLRHSEDAFSHDFYSSGSCMIDVEGLYEEEDEGIGPVEYNNAKVYSQYRSVPAPVHTAAYLGYDGGGCSMDETRAFLPPPPPAGRISTMLMEDDARFAAAYLPPSRIGTLNNKSSQPGRLYTNTSDYYSGLSSTASTSTHSPPSASSTSQISPAGIPPNGGRQFQRENSFRVIQRYPIPITEL